MPATIIDRLGSLLRRRAKVGNIHGILSVGRFRTVVDRERGRSDRNSHGFSLVVFEGEHRMGEELAKGLLSRIRFTDEIGWLSDRQIGVLLPETTAAGARKFSDHVRCAMARKGYVPGCQVYSYPSENWLDDSAGSSGQLCFADLIAEAESASSRDATLSESRLLVKEDQAEELAGSAVDGQTLIGEICAVRPPGWKRVIDVTGAACLLVFFAPVMALIGLLIKLVSPGPVFFRQERVGFMGKRFMCWKFRTMKVDNDATSHESHLKTLIKSGEPMTKLDLKKDPRIIPMGKVLRQTGLDELPQLFNVLLGDMSIIGPRPCIPYEYDEYDTWQRRRVEAMPGLTGLWQVSGKNRTTFAEMMRLDIRYGRKRSLLLDVLILLRTLPAIADQVRDGLNKRVFQGPLAFVAAFGSGSREEKKARQSVAG